MVIDNLVAYGSVVRKHVRLVICGVFSNILLSGIELLSASREVRQCGR